MPWSILNFGKHNGKSLPEVLFTDPDWFFWAIQKDVFRGKWELEKEAGELDHKARRIRIPSSRKEKLVAEYSVHPPTGKFGSMEIVPSTRPAHVGSTPTFRRDAIDLSIPREIAPYDKLGCRQLISSIKHYLFGSRKQRMTKKKCEDFFDNDANFNL
jgi:hypothetical protein